VSKSNQPKDRLAHAIVVRRSHEAELLAVPGVVGVGVGLRVVEGRYTDEIAIVVMVKNKLPPDDLPPEHLLPTELDGIPVDVQEVGTIRAQG